MHQHSSWGTHVWVRDTQRKIQGCLCGWHLQITNTHNYVHTCSGEGRLIMQYKDSHEVKMRIGNQKLWGLTHFRLNGLQVQTSSVNNTVVSRHMRVFHI